MSQEVRLLAYPRGAPVAGDFRLVETAMPQAADGEALVAVEHLSMDPVVRMRMRATSAMGPPLRLDAVVEGRGVGRVLASRTPSLGVGDAVAGELGWRTHAVLPAAELTRLPPDDVPLRHHLNALGPTGLAAWFAVDLARPAPGETLLVAPGAGAVGSLAAQIAHARGARVVATARGSVQRAYLATLGVTPTDPDDLALPEGIDALIDGVGGAFHDGAVARLNPHARVILIGFVSGYNDAGPPAYGRALPILMRRATMTGFLLSDHAARFDEARAALAAMLEQGSLVPAETLWSGLAQAPSAFAALFADARPGKQIVAVAEACG